MPHHVGLEPLYRDLYLPAPRTDPGGRVLGEPGQDLGRGPVLRRRIRGRDVRVQLRRERLRLRSVHHHFDEPHRLPVTTQPTLRHAGHRVEAGHPRLVPLPRQRPDPAHTLRRGCEITLRETSPFGEVIVIRPPPIGLQIIPRSSRRTPIHLQPAAHFPTPFNNNQQCIHLSPESGAALPILVACVPRKIKDEK